MVELLAQIVEAAPRVAEAIPTWITTAIQQFGIGAVLVWHLYHVTTKTLPDMQNVYLTSQKEISQNNSLMHKSISDNFINALKEEREHRRLELFEDREERKKEWQEMREFLRKESQCKYPS